MFSARKALKKSPRIKDKESWTPSSVRGRELRDMTKFWELRKVPEGFLEAYFGERGNKSCLGIHII